MNSVGVVNFLHIFKSDLNSPLLWIQDGLHMTSHLSTSIKNIQHDSACSCSRDFELTAFIIEILRDAASHGSAQGN